MANCAVVCFPSFVRMTKAIRVTFSSGVFNLAPVERQDFTADLPVAGIYQEVPHTEMEELVCSERRETSLRTCKRRSGRIMKILLSHRQLWRRPRWTSLEIRADLNVYTICFSVAIAREVTVERSCLMPKLLPLRNLLNCHNQFRLIVSHPWGWN